MKITKKIFRQYQWMRVLRFLLNLFVVIPIIRIFLILLTFILIPCIGLWLSFGPINSMSPFVASIVINMLLWAYLRENCAFEIWFEKIGDWPLIKLQQYYERKWGVTENDVKLFISKRDILGEDFFPYTKQFVHKLCMMNSGAKPAQYDFLSDRFFDEEIQSVFESDNTEWSDGALFAAINHWSKNRLGNKKDLLEYLFKLSIVVDGIHNDEWNFLLELMGYFKFNKNYISHFKNRYSSLRTEFEEWEKRSTSTEENKATSTLKAYYATLGLEESASDEEVKKAYHALAMQHHPDLPKNADRVTECESMMAKINEAYEKIRG